MNTREARQSLEEGREGKGDAHLRERLRGIAAARSPVVRNGRFFYQTELNALTYWYEDHAHSTRMVYVEADDSGGS
ncbi:MAG: hypothetical protein ABSG21_14955 [Spirochaetia bacterium]|jgi:hypothetical protein